MTRPEPARLDPAASSMDPLALVRFIAGLKEDRTRHPFTAGVRHVGEDGESAQYRLEMWVDGASALCTTVGNDFVMRYTPATRVLYVREGNGQVHQESDRDYPAGFPPLAMAHPLHLPIWGGPHSSGSPAAITRVSRTRFEVLVNAPEDGGEALRVGRALIDTELMAALEFEWFGSRYLLEQPQRLVMPQWDRLLD